MTLIDALVIAVTTLAGAVGILWSVVITSHRCVSKQAADCHMREVEMLSRMMRLEVNACSDRGCNVRQQES